MAYAPKRLYIGQPAAAGTTLYTSAGESTIVKQIAITSTVPTQTMLSLHLVPSGGTPSAANALVYNRAFDGLTITTINLSQVLDEGDSLYALQSSANALTVIISGVTYLA